MSSKAIATLFGRAPRVGYITIPCEGQMQARIVRSGHAKSKLFSVSKHDGDHAETWHAACDWLESLYGEFRRQPTHIHRKRSSRRTTEGAVGVSLREVQGRRDANAATYYRFDVSWYDNSGKKRGRSFSVGRTDVVDRWMINAVSKVAHDFRQAFEAYHRAGLPFDPTTWDNWREDYGIPRAEPKTSDDY